jgi:hypothetical protein
MPFQTGKTYLPAFCFVFQSLSKISSYKKIHYHFLFL